jgi:hypothetical protein
MKSPLWISGEIMADIGDSYRRARLDVSEVMNVALANLDLGEGFNSLILIPIIRDQEHPNYGDVRRYNTKTRDFELRLKTSYDAFRSAGATEQRRLVVENLLRAVEEMRKMHVRGVNCNELEHAIREVAASKGWLPELLIH